jgi:hypothetical protein
VFQRDYILRLVEQLAQALVRVSRRRAAGEEDRLEEELDELARTSFGMRLDMLADLPADELFRVVLHDRGPDFERLALLVRVFCERSRARERAAAHQPLWARKALHLAAVMIEKGGGTALASHREALAAVLALAEESAASPSLLHDLWLGYEAVGAYARAEDKLYAMSHGEPSLYADAGEAFYRRLLTRDDDELDAGGLPRDEVQEGLDRWTRRARLPSA